MGVALFIGPNKRPQDGFALTDRREREGKCVYPIREDVALYRTLTILCSTFLLCSHSALVIYQHVLSLRGFPIQLSSPLPSARHAH